MSADQEQIIDVYSWRAQLFSKTLRKLWPRLNPNLQRSALEKLGTMRAAANGDVIAQAEMIADDADTEVIHLL